MATSRLLTLAAAAALGLSVSGGTAYAAATDSTTTAPTGSAAAPAVPAVPAGAESVTSTTAAGVSVTSYVVPAKRGFGFNFSGLQLTDKVTVEWNTVLVPYGAVSTNVYRGTDPAAGRGEWYSGTQPGWLSATATVRRDGAVIQSAHVTNDDAVRITARRGGNSFTFKVVNALPGDRMLVQWTTRDGGSGSYEGVAEDFTQRVRGWNSATIRVYAGTNQRLLVAPPVTLTRG